MLKTAKKYNTSFAPLKLPRDLKLSLPIWNHIGINDNAKIRYNDRWAKCQRHNHLIKTVKDMLIHITINNVPRHHERKNCACTQCKEYRRIGCQNPKECRKAGRKIMEALGDKWNPNIDSAEETTQHQNLPQDTTPFNANIAIKNHLKEGFRIFANTSELDEKELTHTRTNNQCETNHVTTYTDGSCTNNGYENAKAGSGVWYGQNDARNIAHKLPQNVEQSNNAGEIAAVLLAVKNTHPDDTLTIKTD
ncbi:hypothetical protein BD779DRAFT_1413794, partial [Infundibulicybe gibba]